MVRKFSALVMSFIFHPAYGTVNTIGECLFFLMISLLGKTELGINGRISVGNDDN